MLQYMLDTSICTHVLRNYQPELRELFAEQLCMSSVTLGELYYDAKKSARFDNLQAVQHFRARLEVLPFAERAATDYGQIRAHLERAGRLGG